MKKTTVGAVVLSALAIGQSAQAISVPVVRTGVGQNAALVQAALDAFRADLGPLQPNGPSTGAGPDNRREVNWDGVPDALSSGGSSPFPGDFFNQPTGQPAGRVRGIQFSSAGQLKVSASAASGVGILFSDLWAENLDDFAAFSQERIFGIDGGVEMDVTFSVPGTPGQTAVSRGFGVIFTDVEAQGGTRVDYYDLANTLIASVEAPAFLEGGSDTGKSFSFVGVSFDDPIVARVHIVNGGYDVSGDLFGASDIVAMDDFIFGEPVPVPEPAAAALALAAAVAVVRRRR